MTARALDWNAFEPTNAIGDPGRQPEIRAASGPLNVGVPDTALDFLTAGDLEVRACSTRGWSHRYKGTPRQDSYCLLVNDDIVVVAVADGVSEGTHSQVAAETAARSACKLVADQMAKTSTVDWLQLARRISLRIIEEGEYRQIAPSGTAELSIDDRLRTCLSAMSTTLIVAVIQRTPTSAGVVSEIAVVAGDSAAYLLRDGTLSPMGGGKSDDSPIASTGVRPLPSPVEPTSQVHHLLPGDVVVVGTDGIGDPVGDGTGEVGREFAFRWASPPTIDQFLLDVNVYRRSYDDDRTAVAVWIRPDLELPSGPAPEHEPAAEADPEPAAPGLEHAEPAEATEPVAAAVAREVDLAPEPSDPPHPTETTQLDHTRGES